MSACCTVLTSGLPAALLCVRVQPDVEVRDRLHQVASTLQAQVPDGKQKEAYSDVVKAAAAAIGLA